MDGLSNAASALAVASVAIRLADGCIKLHQFWKSVRGAPAEVSLIMDDLMLLKTVVQDISRDKQLAPSVAVGLECCLTKILELNGIAEEFDLSFRSASRRERLWSAFKASTRSKQLKKFRDSLSETKSTLMLALMYQNIQRPPICFTKDDVQIVQVALLAYTEPEKQLKTPILTKGMYDTQHMMGLSGNECREVDPAATVNIETKPNATNDTSLMSNGVVKAFLKHSLQLAVENLFDSGTVEELMDKTISRATTFESTSSGEYTSEGYSIHNPSLSKTRRRQQTGVRNENNFPSFRFSRSRVCHRISSMGVVVGSIWVRTSTLRLETSSTGSGGNFQIITSFIFYPASWLTRIGFRYGVEASLRNSKDGWQFDFNPIRAVPDNSLIFELCRTGQVRPVELLIQRGDASIRDTSSKGWMPLHFAAAGGHVDLCASLIRSGADKTALVYEGPSQDTLSPITIFAASAHELPAEKKIQMLRLFSDCLELSDPSDDGWTVHRELKKAYNKEKVPVSKNSMSWLLRTTATEKFVAFGPKTVWHALQYAVRSFLVHERDNQVLQRLLNLSESVKEMIGATRATSIAHWLALRASQRELLPMILEAGRFLHLGGFDWVEDDITPSQFVRALPVIYTTWSLALPNSIDKVEELIGLELENFMTKTAWTRQFLLDSISHKDGEAKSGSQENSRGCSTCGDDYSSLGIGVVAPGWIAFIECIKTDHKFHCACSEFLQKSGPTETLANLDDPIDGDPDVDEEFFRETDEDISKPCEKYLQMHIADKSIDPFLDAATHLYRTQGRTWLNCYEPGDLLCATCFLLSEGYIGEDGLGAKGDFSPMPESFVMFRSENYSSTIEKEG